MVYILIITWVVLFKLNDNNSLIANYHILVMMGLLERFTMLIIPFMKFDYIDFILNIILFIPLGFYLSFLFNKKYMLKITLIGFVTSLVYEVIQLFTLLGGFSSNDLIANTIGALIGYLTFKCLLRQKDTKIKYIISVISLIVFVLASTFGLVNTLRYIEIYYQIITRTL